MMAAAEEGNTAQSRNRSPLWSNIHSRCSAVVLVESVQSNIADYGLTQVFDQLAALIDFKGT